MVSENWKHSNKAEPASISRAFRDSQNFPTVSRGAPTQKRDRQGRNAFLGFIMLVTLYTVLLWLAVRVAESAEIVSWSIGMLDSLKLATLYVLWQSLSLVSLGSVKKR
jgi:hypothetical protein